MEFAGSFPEHVHKRNQGEGPFPVRGGEKGWRSQNCAREPCTLGPRCSHLCNGDSKSHLAGMLWGSSRDSQRLKETWTSSLCKFWTCSLWKIGKKNREKEKIKAPDGVTKIEVTFTRLDFKTYVSNTHTHKHIQGNLRGLGRDRDGGMHFK